MAVELSNALIRSAIERAGYGDPPPGKLHLLGLRGATPHGPTAISLTDNLPNRYNDTILAFGTSLQLFAGSVDPGATWTLRPSNPQGCAHLVNGAWRYQRGLHRGKRALVQAGPVTVRRDRDRDGKPEPGEPLDTGWFGINIHAGGSAPTVDSHSAGCQIIAGGWNGAPWREFMDLIDAAAPLQNNRFWYYLLDAKALTE